MGKIRYFIYLFTLLFYVRSIPQTLQIDHERLWLLNETLEHQIKVYKERLKESPEAEVFINDFKGHDIYLLYSQLKLIDENVLWSVQAIIGLKEEILILISNAK